MKRANGTGSIIDLGPNRRRRYAVRVSYQERPGLWKQRYLSYHRTAREAQEALEAHLRAGTQPAALATTWGDVYAQWAEKKYRRANPASIASYRASWGRLRALEGREMCRVTIDDLQRIIDQDEAARLSQSSINNDKLLMKALFKHAMERDIVVKDYSAFVEMPNVGTKQERGAFSDLQMQHLEELVRQGFPWADTVLMLCYTGFRISEFLGLTRASYHPEQGGYLQGGLKTDAGRDRIVPVHPKISPYLATWLAREGDTIICNEHGKKLNADRYRKLFSEVAAALGIPQATPHWCRHTAASRMKMAGMDELAIRRILGHANKDITEHYTHVDIGFLAAEIQKLS